MTDASDILVPMKCGHVYHSECLDNYAKSVPGPFEELRCPECRLSAVDVGEAQSRLLAHPPMPTCPNTETVLELDDDDVTATATTPGTEASTVASNGNGKVPCKLTGYGCLCTALGSLFDSAGIVGCIACAHPSPSSLANTEWFTSIRVRVPAGKDDVVTPGQSTASGSASGDPVALAAVHNGTDGSGEGRTATSNGTGKGSDKGERVDGRLWTHAPLTHRPRRCHSRHRGWAAGSAMGNRSRPNSDGRNGDRGWWVGVC